MDLRPISREAGIAVCSAPEHLPLVDAAHHQPGGPAGKELARTLCRRCPIGDACLTFAVTHAQRGAWAGTSQKARTEARQRGERTTAA